MTVLSTKNCQDNELKNREYPIIHPTSDAPLCSSCQQLELPFFDPSCPGCMQILQDQNTTVSQIFAVIRQWMPQTQQNIETLVGEILKKGAHIDDRDGLTDMTLLHYACKAGAVGVGDAMSAVQTVQMLLEKGADIHLKCRWTDMSAIHYAAYFDIVPVLELLLKFYPDIDVNSPCQEFDGGSCLHIAATNLCVEAAKFILKHGGDISFKDHLKRTPYDCIPVLNEQETMSDVSDIVNNLQKLLISKIHCNEWDATDYSNITGRTVLKSLRLKLGDKIIVGGAKMGILRYCGTTKFAPGIWAGVELEEPLGKNNGTLDGVTYFKCMPYHGIFAPISKIYKYGESKSTPKINVLERSLLPKHINHPKIDVSRVTSKIQTGLSLLKSQLFSPESKEWIIGDKVFIGSRNGTIKFIDETKFAPGMWYGIELDKAEGKNNGCVHGIKYFDCKENHGLFVSVNKLSKFRKNSEDTSSDQSSGNLNMSNSLSSTDGENDMCLNSGQSNRSLKKKRSFSHSANSPNSNTNLDRRYWLTIGMNVLVNNEIAVLKFIGKTEFADGTWLGVELRKPEGKNDGSVLGRRYFTCKPRYGLMVRPNRVTVRGIKGSKLIGTNT